MGKTCEVCKKGVMNGNTVSHAVNRAHKRWSPNVQNVRVMENGANKYVNVCTRCLRSGKVVRALPKVRVEAAIEA